MNSNLVMIGVRENIYAAAASSAFEQAESNAESYPVLYPEPFNSIGCGWGCAGNYVTKLAQTLANEMNLDWECCLQTDLFIIRLWCGNEKLYAIFERRLQERLSLVRPWIEFIPAEENSSLEATEPVVDCSPR